MYLLLLMSQIVKFQCPHCNAPVDVNPEDAVFNCISCGQAFLSDGTEFKNHYILENRFSQKQIRDMVKGFIKKKGFMRGIKDYKITKFEPTLMPFWVATSDAYTHYVGYKRYTETKTRSVGSGKNRRTVTDHVTVYRPVDQEIREKRVDVLLGRRGSSMYGYRKVKQIIQGEFSHAVPFNHDRLMNTEKEFEYLSTEISLDAANQLAKTAVFDDHRSRAERACTKVFDCATQIAYTGTYFVHAPVWQVEYVFQNETYKIAILGSSGKIIAGEIPVTTRFRMMFLGLTTILFLGGGVGSYFLGQDEYIFPIVFGVIVAIIGFFTLKNVFKPVSVVD